MRKNTPASKGFSPFKENKSYKRSEEKSDTPRSSGFKSVPEGPREKRNRIQPELKTANGRSPFKRKPADNDDNAFHGAKEKKGRTTPSGFNRKKFFDTTNERFADKQERKFANREAKDENGKHPFKKEGEFKKREEGGFKKRGEGEFKKRGEGEFKKRGEGEFKKRGEGEFKKRGEGEFKKRGDFGDKPAFKKRGEGEFEKRGDFGDKPAFKKRGEGEFEKRGDFGDKSSFKKRGEGEFKKRGDAADKPAFKKHDDTTDKPGKRLTWEDKPIVFKSTRKKAESDEDGDGKVKGEMPLNKFIAHSGLCSRRKAVDFVKDGKVTVNGELVVEPAFKVTVKDDVRINGNRITVQKHFVYILLNKPKGYITTTDDPEGRKTVMELIEDATEEERVYPVGRLDRNTSGLLLLTNDGELAQKLAHPSHNIKKIYHVGLDKPLTKADFDKIVAGVTLEDGVANVDALGYVEAGDKTQIGIEIHSGKNRIVRRIFEHLEYQVEKLDRVTYAGLTKKNIPRGQWRFLTEKEIILLKHFK